MPRAKPIRSIPDFRDGHHPLSPSSSHRWLHCLASPWLEAEARLASIETPVSDAALEGTAAHDEAEQVLLGKKPECVDYPEAQEYVDYVRKLLKEYLVEVDLSYTSYIPKGRGMADALGLEGRILHVVDLKYGKGIKVDAIDNTQGKLYLLGALETLGWMYEFDRMVFHIHQPRLGHVDKAEYTVDEIREFGESVKATLETMLTVKELPASPGEGQCRWCLAAAVCKARQSHVMQIARAEFSPVPAGEARPLCPDPKLLSEDQLAKVVKLLPQLESWINAVKAEALSLANEDRLPGYKLVEGRSLRKWINQSTAESVLSMALPKDVLYTQSFLSVAQAEKQIGKRAFKELEKELVTRTIGKAVIAPLSDKRTAVNATAQFEPIKQEPTK